MIAVDENFEQFLSCVFPSGQISEHSRKLYLQEYEREQAKVNKGAALFRLKDVKEFWFLMSLTLPKPVHKSKYPWLYDIDWHFDAIAAGLKKHGDRIPKETRPCIEQTSERARELFKAGQIEAARDLMAQMWNVSWTRKVDLETLPAVPND